MTYEIVDRISWKEMRENMKNAEGIMAKASAFSDWLHAKRHKGEWTEDTRVSVPLHSSNTLSLLINTREPSPRLLLLFDDFCSAFHRNNCAILLKLNLKNCLQYGMVWCAGRKILEFSHQGPRVQGVEVLCLVARSQVPARGSHGVDNWCRQRGRKCHAPSCGCVCHFYDEVSSEQVQ
jgi:hypothetical protein